MKWSDWDVSFAKFFKVTNTHKGNCALLIFDKIWAHRGKLWNEAAHEDADQQQSMTPWRQQLGQCYQSYHDVSQ
jgi:hypothetical protein